MKQVMHKLLLLLAMLPITSFAGTTPIEYQPSPMSLTNAINVVDQSIMTQHPNWRPDYVQIFDQYIYWGKGAFTQGNSHGGIFFSRSSSTSRDAGDRLYFNTIHRIELASWRRDWFVVSVRDGEDEIFKHVLRTTDIETARRFVDALEAMVSAYNLDQEAGLGNPDLHQDDIDDSTSGSDFYTRLIELDDLRQRGILTNAEFEAEKKELLDSN